VSRESGLYLPNEGDNLGCGGGLCQAVHHVQQAGGQGIGAGRKQSPADVKSFPSKTDTNRGLIHGLGKQAR